MIDIDLRSLVALAGREDLPALAGRLREAELLVEMRLRGEQHPTTTHMGPEAALSPENIAKRLDVPSSKVYHLLRSGQLRGAKVGKYWRVSPADLASYLRQRTLR